MRSRSLSTKLIFVFLFLAVAAYFSVQACRYFVDPQTTTLVYAYSSEDAIAATGYFARDEQVIACSETLLELERAEGERVNAGGALATVYRSESALNDHRQLRALRSRLEQLRYAREASRDAETALKLDGDIREDLFALRASLAAGSWTSVESSGEELRTTVLTRARTIWMCASTRSMPRSARSPAVWRAAHKRSARRLPAPTAPSPTATRPFSPPRRWRI